MEPPDPIPNSEVKRCIADGSVGFPHVRVGHRQALTPKPQINDLGFFYAKNKINAQTKHQLNNTSRSYQTINAVIYPPNVPFCELRHTRTGAKYLKSGMMKITATDGM